MKNYLYKLSYLTVFLVAFMGCQDAFEIDEEDALDPESTFQTVSDLRAGIFGLYATYSHENLLDLSNFTDDTKIGASNGGQKTNFHAWQLSSGTPEAQALWQNNYTTINTATRLLEAAGLIDVEPEETAEFNRLLGECNAFIALCHFNLLSIYSPEYENNASGVPFIDYVVVPGDAPPRNTFGEVIAGIKAQIALAESRIPQSQNDNQRITLDYLTALRAKVALLENDLTTAINLSQNLIGQYSLANQEQYRNMFLFDSDDTEIIFQLGRVTGDFGPGFIWAFSGGGPFMEMSNTMYNALGGSDESDVRRNVNFLAETSNPANNSHRIGKYRGRDEANESLNNIKVTRVSEMYLINAEAKALNNDLNGAAQRIKQIRDARFNTDTTLPSYGSTQEAIIDILAERRIELAYEGHRYLDVKRLRSITNTGFERAPADCGAASNAAVPCNLPSNDRRFTFPIPQAELDGNENMTQNPGYN